MPGTRYTLEVQARMPSVLAPLEQLANNLLYSWDRQVRGLFRHMDPETWERCAHNPKVFLRRIPQERLEALTDDTSFLQRMEAALAVFRSYREQTDRIHPHAGRELDPKRDLIAYFCAEYGLHESLPIYSGGLGILAGDYLKGASDLGLPFVAVGLMYRQGYFTQIIDENGQQKAHFHPHNLQDLPIVPVYGPEGSELRITVPIAARSVAARIWQAEVGHVRLLLLDTDVPENSAEDRAITYQLYGGDAGHRLAQELILGVGGVRALRALGLSPTVWHINEGHAAFMVLERCRERIADSGDFDCTLEEVASSCVFTTHTPVAAGHDVFERGLIEPHLKPLAEAMSVPVETLLALGRPEGGSAFNMTALGLRGSRFHNGVSQVHGTVASEMERYHWPQIPPQENPIQYVTNGVHVPTFLARQWAVMLDAEHPGWRQRTMDHGFWEAVIDGITDQSFWDLRLALKAELLSYVRASLRRQYRRNHVSEPMIEHQLAELYADGARPLVMGFARRFATYKRAALLFRDPQRLARLLNNPARPVILLFAGKAHPRDVPGQDLIRIINDYAEQPEFEGRLFFLENYDLALARKLVAGVDVWLNTPLYPLEACGTSGQKAAINGALNVSVLDGWWAETWDGKNGWGITPHSGQWDDDQRERREAKDLLDTLEQEVIPLYYEQNTTGLSKGWVEKSKAAMRTVLPRHNAQRMLMDYVAQCYGPANRHGRQMRAANASPCRELTAWKRRVREAWPGVSLRLAEPGPATQAHGEAFHLTVAATLNGLEPEDLRIECVFYSSDEDGPPRIGACYTFEQSSDGGGGETLYTLTAPLSENGLFTYQVRAFPHHRLLAHPFETGCMLWL